MEHIVVDEKTTVMINYDLYRNIKENHRHFYESISLTKKYLDETDDVFKEFINKKLYSNRGKCYVVENILKHWLWGWYYVAVLCSEGNSHRMILLKNLSCDYPTIKNRMEENKIEFNL